MHALQSKCQQRTPHTSMATHGVREHRRCASQRELPQACVPQRGSCETTIQTLGEVSWRKRGRLAFAPSHIIDGHQPRLASCRVHSGLHSVHQVLTNERRTQHHHYALHMVTHNSELLTWPIAPPYSAPMPSRPICSRVAAKSSFFHKPPIGA